MHTKSAILLIGSGRLAKHLLYWNSLLTKPNQLIRWDRSQSIESLETHLRSSSIVWLAISDSAIQNFFDKYLINKPTKVVHFSGALNDPRMLCAHPLMSFPQNILPDEVYKKIHFVINGFENLTEVLPAFQNHYSVLNTEGKALYHALCVLAGNFPQLLWNEVSQQMNKLTLPPEALDLYIKQITENYLAGKESSITGPLIRKDFITIERNISSLENTKKLNNIYTSFTKEFTI